MPRWSEALGKTALALTFCLSGAAASAADWPTATPAEAGFAPDLAAKLDGALESETGQGLHAVVVVRGGRLVYERYLPGDDERWGLKKRGVVFGPDSLHDLRSITKSVVGLLYGAALAEGKVPPIDTPVLDAFPDYADLATDPARRAITVRHLLSMTAGLAWSEDAPYGDEANDETAMNRAPDSLRYALDRPVEHPPGDTWTYSGGATTLLAAMIARGTGRNLHDYARETLFEPLGIAASDWVRDYYGVPYAHAGLRLTPRDAAKLGQLVLQGGRWGETQVVPADWIALSTEPHARIEEYDCHYGFQWWLCATGAGTPTTEGSGYGGQNLIILRDLDLVMMVNAGLYGDPDAWKRAFTLLDEIVVPSLTTAAAPVAAGAGN
jgi:CubicO group peptidase (beta-lactamase class C family)